MEPDRWLGVELRHFLALEAVSREHSFAKAAVALGYTQSAVSQQIATLERLVGQKLIERPGGPKPVSLTEAGRLLLTHAAAIAARDRPSTADRSQVLPHQDPDRYGLPGAARVRLPVRSQPDRAGARRRRRRDGARPAPDDGHAGRVDGADRPAEASPARDRARLAPRQVSDSRSPRVRRHRAGGLRRASA